MFFVSIGAGMTAGRCHGVIAPRHTLGRNRFQAQRDWQKVTPGLSGSPKLHLGGPL